MTAAKNNPFASVGSSRPLPQSSPGPTRSLKWAVVAISFLALWLRFSGISAGLPYFYDEDEAHHFNRVVNMVKTGDLNPHYFLKPSLHFYLRIPFVAAGFLWEVKHGRLRSVKEIDTSDKFGIADYAFSTSHPGVVKWNRAFSVGLSLGMLLLSAAIAWALTRSRFATLATALIIAVSPALVGSAATIGVDTPTAFLCLLTTYLAITFVQNPRWSVVAAAGLCAGLACSTKYNALPIVLVPFLAAWFTAGSQRHLRLLAAILLPAIGFLLGTPYALVSLPLFLDHVAYEIWHYGIAGHEGHMAEPGLAQVVHYGKYLLSSGTGIAAFVAAIFGVLAIARRITVSNAALLIFPVAYMLLMISQRANFTRNMNLVVPYLAIVAAIGAMAGLSFLRRQRFSNGWLRQWGLPAALLVALATQPLTATWLARRANAEVKESREDAAAWIKAHLPPQTEVTMAGQLQFAPQLSREIAVSSFDDQLLSFESLYLMGISWVVVRDQPSLPPASLFTKFQTFAGVKEKQRILQNPAVAIYKVSDHVPSAELEKLAASRLLTVHDTTKGHAFCESTEGSGEEFCWINSRLALLKTTTPVRISFEAMTPWNNQLLTLNDTTPHNFTPGKWERVAADFSAESLERFGGVLFKTAEVHSPQLFKLSTDSRRLGIAVRKLQVESIK